MLIAQYLQTSKPYDKEIKVYHLDEADNDGIESLKLLGLNLQLL